MGTSAKVLAPADVRRLEAFARRGRLPARNQVIINLSFMAGLRACEIAGLDWSMVVTARHSIGESLFVADDIAKNGRGRNVPMHPKLRDVLTKLHAAQGRPVEGPVVRSQRGGHMTPRSIVNWFHVYYRALGLNGCSSHSGRRTFITRSARLVSKVGGSLRDVQELAGHSSLTTTERYIEGNREAQRKLVRML